MTKNEKNDPLITVITVCRNAAATLEACIASVAEQTYPRIEYVVVDGASTDGTAAILERLRAAITVLVREPDSGIFDAMNKGLRLATGDFVVFLNADDAFVSHRVIAEAVGAMAHQPDGDVYYGSILVRGAHGTIRHDPPPPDRAPEALITGCLPHQATFARRAVFDRTGSFDLRWRRHADYDWWLKVLADEGINVYRIPTLVACFAEGGASSDLAKGQPEFFAIQNSARLYLSRDWDRRRIEAYQNAWLAARIIAAGSAERGGVRYWLVRHLPDPVVQAIRWAKGSQTQPHLVGKARSWLVRELPRPVVEFLRTTKRRIIGPRS